MNSTKFIEWVRLYQELVCIRLGITTEKKTLNISTTHHFSNAISKTYGFHLEIIDFSTKQSNGSHSATQSANVTSIGNNKKKKLSQKIFTKQNLRYFSQMSLYPCEHIKYNTNIHNTNLEGKKPKFSLVKINYFQKVLCTMYDNTLQPTIQSVKISFQLWRLYALIRRIHEVDRSFCFVTM